MGISYIKESHLFQIMILDIHCCFSKKQQTPLKIGILLKRGFFYWKPAFFRGELLVLGRVVTGTDGNGWIWAKIDSLTIA